MDGATTMVTTVERNAAVNSATKLVADKQQAFGGADAIWGAALENTRLSLAILSQAWDARGLGFSL
jgi:hypothetical protein